mgnify:CR=1 FL=1
MMGYLRVGKRGIFMDTALDIAPLLAQAIARIHGNESVTSLFDTRG